jgi:hypothetical protein
MQRQNSEGVHEFITPRFNQEKNQRVFSVGICVKKSLPQILWKNSADQME